MILVILGFYYLDLMENYMVVNIDFISILLEFKGYFVE